MPERDILSEDFLTRMARGPKGGWGGWAKDLPYQQWNAFFLLIAVFVYAFAFPLHRAKTFEWDWVAFVVLRNLVRRSNFLESRDSLCSSP